MSAAKSNKLKNIFTVLVGAMLLGFCWRFRGETGWGSSWGLLYSGLIFTMFTVLAIGERKRFDFGWLGLTAVSFMMTVPSWGTLNSQITGILYSEELWGSVPNPTPNYINPLSAIFLMLCLGFGLASIWGVFLGRAYSGKQWRIRELIIILAVFYAVNYISKATVSHLILNLVQPQASEIYSRYLAEAGIHDSVYSVYMHHFDNLAWAKKLDGGRNYFSSIQAVSSALSSAAVLLAVRFIIKDKRSANVGFAVSGAFSLAITIADFWLYLAYGGYHMEHASYLPAHMDSWAMWEYGTGFIAGGIITLVLLKMKKEDDVDELVFSNVPAKVKTVLTFLLSFIFVFGVNIVRPILERTKNSEKTVFIASTAIALVMAAVVILASALKYGFALEKVSLYNYIKYALPCFIGYSLIIYMFVARPFDAGYKYFLGISSTVLVIISATVVIVWCALVPKKKI